MTPKAADVLAALGEPGKWDGAPPKWDEAMAARPAGLPPYVDPGTLAARLKGAGIAVDREPLLAEVAAGIAKDPNLGAFAWYMHWRVVIAPENGVAWGGPSLEKRLGDKAGAFFLLLSLSWPARLAAYHRTLGYPPEVTTETIQEIACYEAGHIAGRGVPGIYEGMYAWLASYLVTPFVRLGRFEYQLDTFDWGWRVFERPADGAVVAMPDDGARMGDDGLRLEEPLDAGQGWTTRFREEDGAFAGNPIDPAGFCLNREVRLPKAQWRQVLGEGDRVLNLHIPHGGSMGWEAVTESIGRAHDFFRARHPDPPFKALVLSTWFMDPRVPKVLGPESNPARFQRGCYLCPGWPDPGGLWFVFQRPVTATPPDELPARTSVQRALIAFLRSGGRWKGGSMFVLPADMTAMREGAYRERFDRGLK